MQLSKAIERINKLGSERTPFIVIFDFLLQNSIVIPLKEVDPSKLLYDFNGFRNYKVNAEKLNGEYSFHKSPITYEEYLKQFNKVKREIEIGNTYLINLTCATPLKTNLTSREIFFSASALYKLALFNRFICFSPEIFVKIADGKIYSHPMKGTIDASTPGAGEIILADKKEKAEHYTIVDLIRNDLNIVSRKVKVEKFRYFDLISTNSESLLQVSSIVSGELQGDYYSRLGEILAALLPAGSVTGAPKKKTVEIILNVEEYERDFYTGAAGIFDGTNFDSCVLIRYIQTENLEMIYKSGGGITSFSSPEKEYKEMLDKVYLPIFKV